MERAIGETNRRRSIQMQYNAEHGIIPKTIRKDIRDVIEIGNPAKSERSGKKQTKKMSKTEKEKLIAELTVEMKNASRRLEFEQAAFLRDKIKELREEK